MKGKYWKVDDCRYKLQLKTTNNQNEVEDFLSGWECVSFGYAPTTEEDILIFEKTFSSVVDWTNFLNSDKINETIELKEIQ
jgi:hypothetical protein